MTEIEEEAFAGNKAAIEVVLPENLTKIGARAFADTNILLISIPASVTDIAENAFEGSPNLSILCENDYMQRYAQDHGISFVRME